MSKSKDPQRFYYGDKVTVTSGVLTGKVGVVKGESEGVLFSGKEYLISFVDTELDWPIPRWIKERNLQLATDMRGVRNGHNS